jgi:hypothetical protein
LHEKQQTERARFYDSDGSSYSEINTEDVNIDCQPSPVRIGQRTKLVYDEKSKKEIIFKSEVKIDESN